jgi:hypothetical protein
VFRTRCAWAIERCAAVVPQLEQHGTARVACIRVGEIAGPAP